MFVLMLNIIIRLKMNKYFHLCFSDFGVGSVCYWSFSSFYVIDVCLGMKSDLEMLEERDEVMRNKYHDPIERFPDKIGQLLDALNRVCSFILSSAF
jgi:hypothetical protein